MADARRRPAGGRERRELTELLGLAAFVGIPPLSLLRAHGLELPLLIDAMKHAIRYQHERDEALARLVVNEYAKSQRKARR